MKGKLVSLLLFLMVVQGLCLADAYDAERLVTGPYNDKGVLIPDGQVWTCDFSSRQSFYKDVHATCGYDGGMGGYGYGDGRYWWAGGIGVGTQANGNTGWVIWKFVAPEKKIFSGGTVTAKLLIQSGLFEKEFLFFGTAKTFTPDNYTYSHYYARPLVGPIEGFNGYFYDRLLNWIPDNVNSPDVMTADVNIPPNVSEFYFLLGDNGTSRRFGIIGDTPFTVNPIFADDPNACITDIPGDTDGDCDVDMVDLAVLANNWLTCMDYDNPKECPPEIVP